jgi:hypothetical protein
MSDIPKKKEPLVPGGPWKEEELLVCRYNKAEQCAYDRYPSKEEYERRNKQ